MNMILHNNPTALIVQGNTLTDPKFKDGDTLKTFDYVVANPPFSDKRWSTGLDPLNDPYERFQPFGTPPAKQGDYAYLLHIVRSLKSTGKGACILPHGVLFRGNAEADIRRNLVRKGYIKGIIGLPANLFYGTGIPACIVVIDKEDAHARKGIFMIDASARLHEGRPQEPPARPGHPQDRGCLQPAARSPQVLPHGLLRGDREERVQPQPAALHRQPDARGPAGHRGPPEGRHPRRRCRCAGSATGTSARSSGRPCSSRTAPAISTSPWTRRPSSPTIYEHPEFAAFIAGMNAHFAAWRQTERRRRSRQLQAGCHPKEVIAPLSEDLLAHYAGKPLIDPYDVYQHLMDYWAETMQDDCYLIAADGWKAETSRIIEKDKKGKEKDKGWTCDLVPKALIVARYFAKEQAAIDQLAAELEGVTARLTELEEEHGGEDGAFSELDKVNKANVTARLKEIKGDKGASERREPPCSTTG